MLYTKQFDATVDFYVNRLGFFCAAKDDNSKWAAVYRDNIEIMITAPYAHTGFVLPVFTGSLYITVSENIDALWEELKDKAQFCYEIESFVYGMCEFALYDLNGYLLQFGQQIKK